MIRPLEIWKTGVCAGLIVLSAACGGGKQDEQPAGQADTTIGFAADERAYFEALSNAPFTLTGPIATAPVDFAAAFVNLPGGFSLKSGASSLNETSGATVVKDFSIVFDLDGEDVGLLADEAVFYGFNPAAITDRVQGTNLNASVKVADRIELRGVKSVGMEALSERFLQEYVETLDEMTPMDGEILDQAMALEFFEYNFEVDQVVLDGLVLEPFAYRSVDIEPPSDGAANATTSPAPEEALQLVGAYGRAFSFDALVYRDMTFDYSVRQAGLDISMDMGIGLSGVRDYRRGDLGFSGSWDTRFEGAFPIPQEGELQLAATDVPESKLVKMQGKLDFSAISDMRLARAFEALADWTMPDATETDFMRIGRFELANYSMTMGGKRIFNADKMLLDADFHWLLPQRITVDVDNLGYEIANLFEVISGEMGGSFDEEFSLDDVQAGLAIINQYGFGCLCGDFAVDAVWNEETGRLTYDESGTFADAFSSTNLIDLTVPTPAKVAELLSTDAGEEAFEDAFQDSFAFHGFEFRLQDQGGMTRAFAMLHDIGKAFPEQQGMAILTYNEPDQLRALAVNAVNSAKPMVRAELPQADPWMDAIGEFLEQGGALRVAAQPSQPVTFEILESLEDTEPDPDRLIDLFGFSVTHTK